MKVAELIGADLDYLVAKAEGYELDSYGDNRTIREDGGAPSTWHPSTDWAQGGPIIYRERISLDSEYSEGEIWCAMMPDDRWIKGPTPLIAAMRAYVASRFGEDVQERALNHG